MAAISDKSYCKIVLIKPLLKIKEHVLKKGQQLSTLQTDTAWHVLKPDSSEYPISNRAKWQNHHN